MVRFICPRLTGDEKECPVRDRTEADNKAAMARAKVRRRANKATRPVLTPVEMRAQMVEYHDIVANGPRRRAERAEALARENAKKYGSYRYSVDDDIW